MLECMRFRADRHLRHRPQRLDGFGVDLDRAERGRERIAAGKGEPAHRYPVSRAKQDDARHSAAHRSQHCVNARCDRPGIDIARVRRYERLGGGTSGAWRGGIQQLCNGSREFAAFAGIEGAGNRRGAYRRFGPHTQLISLSWDGFSSARDTTGVAAKISENTEISMLAKAYALIPAAGTGMRVGAAVPKQYLEVDGKPLLYYALRALTRHPRIEQVFVVLAPGDANFKRCDWSELEARIKPLYCGGETRAASVFNGLLAARDTVAGSDWVLVHDAARPCLGRDELDRLFGELDRDDTGGLAAARVGG